MNRLDEFWRQAKEHTLSLETKDRNRVRLEASMMEPAKPWRSQVRIEGDDCLQEQMDTLSPFWTTAKSPVLSADRKDVIRARLQTYAQPDTPVLERYVLTWKRITASLAAAFSMGSMGLCSAAEGAVPGDALYPIKTNINEPVLGVFAISAESRAAWQIRIAERRLWEEQLLLARGVDPATVAEFQTVIDARMQEARTALQLWATEHPAEALHLQTRIETMIKTRESIRSEIESSPDSREGLSPLLEQMQERRELRLMDR